MIYTYEREKVHACPDRIFLPKQNINSGWKNGIAFVAGVDENGDIRFLAQPYETHHYLLMTASYKIGRLSNRIEGRIWEDIKILTIWNDVASEDVALIVGLFKKVQNIDISNYYFASEFDDHRAFSMPVKTFIKLGIGNNWLDPDWYAILAEKKREEDAENVKYSTTNNNLGFDNRDYLRHYMYNENKKNMKKNVINITESDIRDMVKSCLNEVVTTLDKYLNKDERFQKSSETADVVRKIASMGRWEVVDAFKKNEGTFTFLLIPVEGDRRPVDIGMVAANISDRLGCTVFPSPYNPEKEDGMQKLTIRLNDEYKSME